MTTATTTAPAQSNPERLEHAARELGALPGASYDMDRGQQRLPGGV